MPIFNLNKLLLQLDTYVVCTYNPSLRKWGKKPEEVDREVILYTGSHDLRRKIADSSRDA